LYEPVKRYVFNVRASFLDETRNLVDRLWNDAGARKIALVYQDDAMGASGLQGVRAALEAHQATLVAQASVPRATADVDLAVQTIRAADPQAVIIVSSHIPAAEFVKRAKATGWNPLFLSIGGRDSFAKTAGPAGG